MRQVTVRWAGGPFAQDIEIGGLRLRDDVEKDKGGEGTGPGPLELLLAALGSCTGMTLKVYAERKGWPLTNVVVEVDASRTEAGFVINRRLTLEGNLDAEQRQRLLEIADKCPVHKTLSGTITIQTTTVPATT